MKIIKKIKNFINNRSAKQLKIMLLIAVLSFTLLPCITHGICVIITIIMTIDFISTILDKFNLKIGLVNKNEEKEN